MLEIDDKYIVGRQPWFLVAMASNKPRIFLGKNRKKNSVFWACIERVSPLLHFVGSFLMQI
jgi:hypothetical protein